MFPPCRYELGACYVCAAFLSPMSAPVLFYLHTVQHTVYGEADMTATSINWQMLNGEVALRHCERLLNRKLYLQWAAPSLTNTERWELQKVTSFLFAYTVWIMYDLTSWFCNIPGSNKNVLVKWKSTCGKMSVEPISCKVLIHEFCFSLAVYFLRFSVSPVRQQVVITQQIAFMLTLMHWQRTHHARLCREQTNQKASRVGFTTKTSWSNPL